MTMGILSFMGHLSDLYFCWANTWGTHWGWDSKPSWPYTPPSRFGVAAEHLCSLEDNQISQQAIISFEGSLNIFWNSLPSSSPHKLLSHPCKLGLVI